VMPALIENLLWYGFLGLVPAEGNAIYIHDLNYNWAALQGRHKGFAKTGRTYEINPAFWAGLEIQTPSVGSA
jgi:hypothetical protein